MKKDHPELAVVIYDNLPDRCKDIRQNLYDITKFKCHGRYDLFMYDSNNITATLRELADQHEWAVVVSVGTMMRDQALIFDMIDRAKEENSPLVCHILDRGGYYHFHHQYFAINLKAYQDIGCPALEEQSAPITITTRKTDRSAESVHDDYTPWWLKPVGDTTEYHSDREYFGINVIAGLINAGHNITNLTNKMRERKDYCYPEHNVDQIKLMIADPHYRPPDPTGPLWWFAENACKMTKGLEVGYYVLNTEPMYSHDRLASQQYNCFIGVASGVKPACIVGSLNFADNSRVILTDISPAALTWQKFLYEKWDGDFAKFEELFQQFAGLYPDLQPIYYRRQTFGDLIDWFFSNINLSPDEFQQYWKRYQSMNVEFVQMNLLDESSMQQVCDWIVQSQGSYVWTSNLFNMDYLSFYRTTAWAHSRLLEFKRKLRENISVSCTLENGSLHYFYP